MARLQAQAFHESSSFAPLDSLLYYVFQVIFPSREAFSAFGQKKLWSQMFAIAVAVENTVEKAAVCNN